MDVGGTAYIRRRLIRIGMRWMPMIPDRSRAMRIMMV